MKKMKVLMSGALAVALGLAGAALVDGRARAQAAGEMAQPAAPEVYVVKDGDTLGSIATKLTGSESNWTLIARENGLVSSTKSDKLEVGKRLKIPEKLRQS